MKRGDVVIAKAGKEKGGLFVVTQVLDPKYVLIADGNHRPLEKPKKKNTTHLKRTNQTIGEIESNRQLRILLRAFIEEVK